MKNKHVILIAVSGLLALNGGVRGDLISDWTGTAGTHIGQNTPGHFQAWRGNTMVRVAMFDAANAAVGGYTPYALNLAAPGASPEAAVAQAAYTVLTNLSSVGLTTLNTALAATLATVPNGPAKDDGKRLGMLAGEAIIRMRAGDNPTLSVPYINDPVVGRWRPTPPNFAAAFGTQGRYLPPWTMRSAAQFRPGPPPALTSEIYTTDYNEIRVLAKSGYDTDLCETLRLCGGRHYRTGGRRHALSQYVQRIG